MAPHGGNPRDEHAKEWSVGKVRILAVAAVLFAALSSQAMAQIYVSDSLAAPSVTKYVRVSVKIMNDASGRRPADGFYHTNEQILTVFDESNATLAAMDADWRLELVEIVDVRGASQWFGPWDCDSKREFEAYARADASRYYYRSNAINIYVISELIGCGGYCSIPSSGDELIIINNRVGILNWSLGWLHEVGHYFGLQHTYQCPDRPCESYHDVCTGAGSEFRDCPDVCPDTLNIMGGRDDLAVGLATFSSCQLSELALAMREGAGVRSKVVDHVEVNNAAATACEATTTSQSPTTSATSVSAAASTPTVSGGLIPRAPEEPLTGGTGVAPSATSGSVCNGGADVTAPEVLRIDAQYAPNSLRVNGIVIQFNESMDAAEVQNGVDIAVTFETTPIDGTIAWRDNDMTLAWTAKKALPAGQYGIFLTGQDKTDFQDRAGNVLQANTDGYFAVGFSLDANGGVVPPSVAACGGSGLFAMLTAAPMAIASRRRRRHRRG